MWALAQKLIKDWELSTDGRRLSLGFGTNRERKCICEKQLEVK